ncbi:uncharacterized protein MAM_05962 [Metarhizium album ARSEF 1941]|uniref:Uncharacterized protein n=1 Tax=Metarhizium album (strain ARSEF 1941) TaxID=1081103 RepID=A0A0B2WR70_METAS|nr:uncharacterized protein MAM_05962 [Metarhizium album ARSEF 1941]KHN96114.1 hypothetical protein MAM_05962 [Metarhizium album ARSEF 1941]
MSRKGEEEDEEKEEDGGGGGPQTSVSIAQAIHVRSSDMAQLPATSNSGTEKQIPSPQLAVRGEASWVDEPMSVGHPSAFERALVPRHLGRLMML